MTDFSGFPKIHGYTIVVHCVHCGRRMKVDNLNTKVCLRCGGKGKNVVEYGEIRW